MNRAQSELVSTLHRLPLFTDLSDQELAVIAGNITYLHYDGGAVIFSEGDVCHELLVVEEGSVRIVKSAPNGRQQLISIERRGNSLAEIPLFDGGRYPASAEAASSTVLLRLPADKFRSICLQNSELSLKVFNVLGHRLRHLVSLVEDLSFSTVRARLIAHLLRLANEVGIQTPRGIQFKLLENNEELAGRLGTVRELISRNLGRLYSAGLIEMKREMNQRVICVPNLAALKAEIIGRD